MLKTLFAKLPLYYAAILLAFSFATNTASADTVDQAKIRFKNQLGSGMAAEDLQLDIDKGKFIEVGPNVKTVFSEEDRSVKAFDFTVPDGSSLTLNIKWEKFPGTKLTGFWTGRSGIQLGYFTFIDVTAHSSCSLASGTCSNLLGLANSEPGQVITASDLGVAFVDSSFDLFADQLPSLAPLPSTIIAFGEQQVYDLNSVLGPSLMDQKLLLAGNVSTDLVGASGNEFVYSYPVPNPISILGASGVFGFSRKLRGRIKSFVDSVHP
jgi:hypothetical protein